MKRILVAGIGNIFMGDDGFGSEVARRLLHMDLPADVEVADFGIRGVDLGYALMDDYVLAILIDSVDRGGAPGTLHVLEPDLEAMQVDAADPSESMIAPHAMDPMRVLQFVAASGEHWPRVLLVGCQPQTLGGDAGCMGLSAAVEAAVDRAVTEVLAIVQAHSRAASPTHGARRLQEA